MCARILPRCRGEGDARGRFKIETDRSAGRRESKPSTFWADDGISSTGCAKCPILQRLIRCINLCARIEFLWNKTVESGRESSVQCYCGVSYLYVTIKKNKMAINIRNPETEQLAEALAKITGETKTEAVTNALRDRLARLKRERSERRLADELDKIAQHCASLPVLDERSPEEILAYDENGLPR